MSSFQVKAELPEKFSSSGGDARVYNDVPAAEESSSPRRMVRFQKDIPVLGMLG